MRLKEMRPDLYFVVTATSRCAWRGGACGCSKTLARSGQQGGPAPDAHAAGCFLRVLVICLHDHLCMGTSGYPTKDISPSFRYVVVLATSPCDNAKTVGAVCAELSALARWRARITFS